MDRKKSLSSRNVPYFIYRNVNSKIIGIDNKDYQTITKYLRTAAENNMDFRFTSELQDKTMSFDDIVKIPFLDSQSGVLIMATDPHYSTNTIMFQRNVIAPARISLMS